MNQKYTFNFQVGRMAILTVSTKNLELADDTNLEKIAEATECYSGADLQSLLYTAQVSTIEGLLENEQVRVVIWLKRKRKSKVHENFNSKDLCSIHSLF